MKDKSELEKTAKENLDENLKKSFDYADVDRKEIPYLEKEKGKVCYQNKEYFEALRHFSKVKCFLIHVIMKSCLAFNILIKDGMITDLEAIAKMA